MKGISGNAIQMIQIYIVPVLEMSVVGVHSTNFIQHILS